MKFKIGDKVIISKPIQKSFDFGIGDVGTIVGILEEYRFPIIVELQKDNNRIKFKESELELYKEDKMEKTFQEVIRDIKEGEVWESDSIAWDIKSIEKNGDFIKIEKRNNSTTLSIRPDCKFLLRRKEVTFQEAFAAYEEGKETQSAVTGIKYQKRRLPYENQRTDCFNSNGDWRKVEDVYRLFSLQEIRGSWYINE